MLTEKALMERKWGWLPGLRLILEGKAVPDRYFGSSSVSDNVFDRVYRLIEIGILVEENRVEIIERLRSDSCRQLMKDLYKLQEAFRNTEAMLRTAQEKIKQIMTSGR